METGLFVFCAALSECKWYLPNDACCCSVYHTVSPTTLGEVMSRKFIFHLCYSHCGTDT